MSIFKCKMCGGALEVNYNETVITCEYCGTKQTLPKLDDEKRANLYDRANHFRRNNEFDKAIGIYEQILNENKTDAEAYWSLVLCKYGIEYVEDPVTHKRVPTVNRTQYTSIFADADYQSALEYADGYQKSVYEEEAKTIDEIQKGILAISQKEEPFDVFICYKETDESGRRTQDSVLANDLYHQLTQEGFRVFFSRITLEDKLGSAYEPYIFAALNSAKVMVVLGTKAEYFNAVWVKNEWSRYLALIKNGAQKMLIPAYRDIDPYDLPEEFSHLQAQDMSKLGFMQDLIRGIKKIVQSDKASASTVVKETIVTSGGTDTAPLLKRAFMFLEDGDFARADDLCEQVLNQDPENAQAYLGKLMAYLKVDKLENLKKYKEPFDHLNDYKKVIRFADEELKNKLVHDNAYIRESNEKARKGKIYNLAKKDMQNAAAEKTFKEIAQRFASISGWKDADALQQQCLEKAEDCRKDAIYKEAVEKMEEQDLASYDNAIKLFQSISGWKDADGLAKQCAERYKKQEEWLRKDSVYQSAKAQKGKNTIEGYQKAIEIFRSIADFQDAGEQITICENEIRNLQEQKIDEEKRIHRKKKLVIILSIVLAVCFVFVIVLNTVILPHIKLNQATALLESGDYDAAYAMLEELGKTDIINSNKYDRAVTLLESGDVVAAYELFVGLEDYKDSAAKADEILPATEIENLNTAEVGSVVTFGEYEQDNDTTNGVESIEWQVLDKQDGKLLLISKYALDCKPYNISKSDVTWETCTLRQWLNHDFYNTAFSTEHQSIIATSSVFAEANPEYSTNPGNHTKDKVFLLSIPEVNKYFTSDSARWCTSTAYVIAQGAYEEHGDSWWWLRSPGYDQDYAATVSYSGKVFENGNFVYTDYVAVRPALWIDLDR